jgi:hypothetical protein
MNIAHMHFTKHPLALIGIFCFLFAAAPRGFASAEDHIDDATVVSKNWVAQIDAGRYDESYDFGCDAMHDKVPQDRWVRVLRALRAPWGPVVNRKQLSHIYKPNGFEGTEGEFMVITYDTAFQKMEPATEVVVLKWDGGKWRGAGYNAGPKPPPDDGSAPEAPASTTEIHTDPSVKAGPQ